MSAIEKIPNQKPINDTGIVPVEFRCVVRLDPIEEKTKGGLYMPQPLVERKQMSATEGTLLEVGGNAFQDWNGRKPQPGDRIMINKYAGITREADPSDLVRVVNDKDIIAIISP